MGREVGEGTDGLPPVALGLHRVGDEDESGNVGTGLEGGERGVRGGVLGRGLEAVVVCRSPIRSCQHRFGRKRREKEAKKD